MNNNTELRISHKEGFNLGNLLYQLRVERGYTIKYVADKLGVTTRTIRYYECPSEEASRQPDLIMIVKICELYDIPESSLLPFM